MMWVLGWQEWIIHKSCGRRKQVSLVEHVVDSVGQASGVRQVAIGEW